MQGRAGAYDALRGRTATEADLPPDLSRRYGPVRPVWGPAGAIGLPRNTLLPPGGAVDTVGSGLGEWLPLTGGVRNAIIPAGDGHSVRCLPAGVPAGREALPDDGMVGGASGVRAGWIGSGQVSPGYRAALSMDCLVDLPGRGVPALGSAARGEPGTQPPPGRYGPGARAR